MAKSSYIIVNTFCPRYVAISIHNVMKYTKNMASVNNGMHITYTQAPVCVI